MAPCQHPWVPSLSIVESLADVNRHFTCRPALDTAGAVNRIGRKSLVMGTDCPHRRTVVIARREGVDYVECLECRQIFEAEDLEPLAVEAEEEPTS